MLLSDQLTAEIVEICRRTISEHLQRQTATKDKKYLSIKEAAEFLDCSPQHLYNLRASGVIKFRKSGNRSLINTAELIAYLERRTK